MNLRDWILEMLQECPFVSIRYGKVTEKDHVEDFKIIKTETEYLAKFGNWTNLTTFSAYATYGRKSYYLFYDEGAIFVAKKLNGDNVLGNKWEAGLSHALLQGSDWKKAMAEAHPYLLEKCDGCKCYNDKVTTGVCSGKSEDLYLWN